jgi:serine/threonine-protein kinase
MPDFEALFQRLKVARLPHGVTSLTTFLPLSDDTLTPAVKEELLAPTTVHLGTLPRLHLATPDAARAQGDEPELVPVEVLGEGGMGQVLLARQTALGRHVAVKVLKHASASPATADSLVHEARTAGGLEHPGVVPIYALARDAQGLPALVMKRVEGVSWRELLRTPEHPSWKKLLPLGHDRLAFHIEVLVQVCNAVAHAHQRRVIHRDVKPANVLLGELGEVYLADWGVAMRLEAPSPRVMLVGTPAYLAPEMVAGESSKMDERTDVYLLGATLHEVLTGAPPHNAEELHDILKHAFESPEPVLPPSAPPLLAAACRRALAADPARRFPSATALRDELKRFLQRRGATAIAEAAAQRLGELESMPNKLSTPFDEQRWNALVFECRFGFTQALKDSPDLTEASTGLKRLLQVAARHEIDREAPETARAFLSELESPAKELTDALAALEAKQAQHAQDAVQLRKLTHELDPRVSRMQRVGLVLGMGVAILVMMLVFTLGRQREIIWAAYEGWFRVFPVGIVCVAFVLAAVIGRRSLFSTVINREMMALFGVAAFGMVVHRSVSVIVGVPPSPGFALDAVFLAALCAFAALVYHRAYSIPLVINIAIATGSVLWPAHALSFFGFGTVASIGVFALVFALWRRGD